MFTIMTSTGANKMAKNGKAPKGVYSPYQVVKVLPDKPIKFICQSKEWEDINTHWYGNHSVKCEGPGKCLLCRDRHAQIWKGYLLGCMQTGGPTLIFQITPLGAYMLEEQTKHARGLLGALLCLTRKGRRANSPLEASIRGWVRDTDEIPFETLERTVQVLYRQYSRTQTAYVAKN
jgi:hypothetical protein